MKEVPSLYIDNKTKRKGAKEQVERYLKILQLGVDNVEPRKRWGIAFNISTDSINPLLDTFFPEYNSSQFKSDSSLRGRILVIRPGASTAETSFRYLTRAWYAWHGKVEANFHSDETPSSLLLLDTKHRMRIKPGETHRASTSNNWGVLVEVTGRVKR